MDSFKRQILTGIATFSLLTASALRAPLEQLAAAEFASQSKLSATIRAQDLTPELPAPEFEEVITPPVEEGQEIVPSGEGVVPSEEGFVMPDNGEWTESGAGIPKELFEPDLLVPHDGPLLHHFPSIKGSGTWLWRGHWYTEQSLVAMIRIPPSRNIYSRDLSVDPLSVNLEFDQSQDPLVSNSNPFLTEAGLKLTFGNIIGRDGLNRDHAIEFSFLGSFEFAARDAIESIDADQLFLGVDFGPGFAFNQFNNTARPLTPGFDAADRHAYLEESELDSYELNLRTRTRLNRDRMVLQPNGKWVRDINSGWISTLHGGIRAVRLHEHLLFTSQGAQEIDAQGILQGSDGSGLLDVTTHNDMFGVQIGGGLLQQRSQWHWGGKVTAGGFYNFADRRMLIDTVQPSLDPGLSTTRVQELEDEFLTFFSDISFFAAWQIRPHVTLRASYNILYFSGVALARNNARVTPEFEAFHIRGDALFHSVSTGFELVW